jgi:ABC-type cobalt transport system substrate-binding protein
MIPKFTWQDVIFVESVDVRQWAETTKITRINIQREGVKLDFSKKSSWPEVTPAGWDNTIQYTLWLAQLIDNKWHAAGIIEFWKGLEFGGGDKDNPNWIKEIGKNWTYFAEPLHQPKEGELVGLFVTAGDQRRKDYHVVEERSNIVFFLFPSGIGRVFDFDEGSPVPTPSPVIVAPKNERSYDDMFRMIEKSRDAYLKGNLGRTQEDIPYATAAHLIWRFLREGYTEEQLITEARLRGNDIVPN